ncbi:hypothetical protein RJ53_10850 [Methanocalculus chunghsingensis]|uniref:Polysaccharide deacetylase n=1 Tax=Methanocalculus chunghsingensis TaxID=156457 RepID=A0A8J7WBL9_9EURY|nr:polysaccharide deacetylase family protein [Methanocalculus chunghsingensis]MBR1369947.1 hypothetical protein [Methanocalculus chunghsingensis]
MYDILRQDPEIWDIFQCKEEYTSPIRDKYDRFPYYLSSNRNIFQPVVSEYLSNAGYRPEYPDGQPFAVSLTHDIDNVYCSLPYKGYHFVKSFFNKDIPHCIDTALSMCSRKIPLCNFQEIMAIEEEYGATSSFNFMALAPGDQDYSYDIRDLERELGLISDAGWEVALHGGHKAYCDYDQLVTEKARLEKVLGHRVAGYRNHFLRFRVPDTWQNLAKAGFLYDNTFGYADCLGFRNGMCHPFRPYDLNLGTEIDIVEIPLAIMDVTFEVYMRLDPTRAWEMTRRLIDTVERYNGVLGILWHNNCMKGDKLMLYKKILAYCSEKGAFMNGGKDLVIV